MELGFLSTPRVYLSDCGDDGDLPTGDLGNVPEPVGDRLPQRERVRLYYGLVNKRFRVCDLNQPFLLAPSLQDWLPQDHLARFIAEVMNELDLSAIYAEYERKDGRGLSAYHPLLLTRLLLYGFSIGVTSSRRIERATYDDVAFRYLAADQHPDHDTIANFRREQLTPPAGLFVQALRLFQQAGLVKLGNVGIDRNQMVA